MNRLLFSAFLLVGVSAFAAVHPDHVKADGHAFYKAGTKVEKKDANLYVPKMGKGKVILEVDGKEVESHAFKTIDLNGRKVFYVVFLSVPGGVKDHAYLLRGTYMRGDNVAVYYGDFFSKKISRHHKFTWDFDGASAAIASDDSEESDTDAECAEAGSSAFLSSCHPGHGHSHHGHGRHDGGRHGRSSWTYVGGFGFHTKITK